MPGESVVRVVVPDLISNSYFPAIAAVELGCFADEGVEAELELLFPVTRAAQLLADGEIDLLVGAAHAPLAVAPEWDRIQLLSGVSRNMYWNLVVRANLPWQRGDLAELRDLRIGAAPGPDVGLVALLTATGGDPASRGIDISPVAAAADNSASFGVAAAEALERGQIDAFWANGMGTAVAVARGVGRVLHDARRDGEPGSSMTFAALMASRTLIEERPELARAAVRAIGRAHAALVADPDVATAIAGRLFPPLETSLIADLIRADVPYYALEIDDAALRGLNDFAVGSGLQSAPAAPDQIVAPLGRAEWAAATRSGETVSPATPDVTQEEKS